MNNKLFKEILLYARQNKNWNGYFCSNDVQEINRLSFHYKTFEIQINEIFHSRVPHTHSSNMISLILDRGYRWFLQQQGAVESLEMFAAPGTIIRMGPQDVHWIPDQANPSLSICIFDTQTDWHNVFPPLLETDIQRMLDLFHNRLDTLMRFLDLIPDE